MFFRFPLLTLPPLPCTSLGLQPGGISSRTLRPHPSVMDCCPAVNHHYCPGDTVAVVVPRTKSHRIVVVLQPKITPLRRGYCACHNSHPSPRSTLSLQTPYAFPPPSFGCPRSSVSLLLLLFVSAENLNSSTGSTCLWRVPGSRSQDLCRLFVVAIVCGRLTEHGVMSMSLQISRVRALDLGHRLQNSAAERVARPIFFFFLSRNSPRACIQYAGHSF